MILLPPQIYREFQLSIVIAKKMRMKMKTRVPRNLFGAPERKDSVHMLQEALDQERSRFHKRWSVDPLAEDDDKENSPRGCSNFKLTPKKRSNPYAKQTSIHDYWRSRKIYEPSKKSPSASVDQPKSPVLVQSSSSQMQSLSFPPAKAQTKQQQSLPLQESLSEPAAQAQSTQEMIVPSPSHSSQQADNQFTDNAQPSTN